MKLEDIRLELGDIISYSNGFIKIIDDADLDYEVSDCSMVNNIEQILKIERYETFKDGLGQPAGDCFKGAYYILKTIWERKEETTKDDIEEVKHRYIYGLNEKEEMIDDRVSEIEEKLNEVIKILNKLNKESK